MEQLIATLIAVVGSVATAGFAYLTNRDRLRQEPALVKVQERLEANELRLMISSLLAWPLPDYSTGVTDEKTESNQA